ncbi:hypothetical protein HNQ02_003646 [Flavobacterium sp. 7E]|uniref:DUF3289 family protein n=1 Tax=Flavobacterium sp. 7E TaxID=2735898 RepID=UPI00156FC228|nr:DUF3289 family protein [Flavobacterium sp. 7E]NRS90699.1 hypothetical protein [Flavobacterium sp. 7E]
MNEEGTATHHDMMSGDMTDAEMLKLNPMFSDEISISEDKLIYSFRNLARTYSMGDLEDVNMRLIDRFVNGDGGEYENESLTYFAEKHESTLRFINNIKKNLSYKLSRNPNFIYNKEEIFFVIQDMKPKLNRKDIPSPSLGKNFMDKISGLGIAVNDTWGYDVILIKFEIDNVKKRYSAILEIELFDHYGLDSLDVDPHEKPDFAKDSGFRSWFYLQHSKKHNLTPFITSIKFKKYIYGKY